MKNRAAWLRTPAATRALDIAARTLLASLGAYAIAALASASLSLALPLPKAQAVLAATMLAFAICCVVAIAAFSAASAGRAWTYGLLAATPPGLHLLWLGGAA